MRILIDYFLLFIFLSNGLLSCDQYPREELQYHENGRVKAKRIHDLDQGKIKEFHYSDAGLLLFEVTMEDAGGTGTYTSYFWNGQVKEKYELKSGQYTGKGVQYYSTGELQSEGIFSENQIVSAKSYDKAGVLYSELLSLEKEVLYQYYNDTSLYSKLHVRREFSDDGSARSAVEDSAFYYSNNGNLIIRLLNGPDSVVLSTYTTEGQFILRDYQVRSKVVLDSVMSYMIGVDSLNLFYDFITE